MVHVHRNSPCSAAGWSEYSHSDRTITLRNGNPFEKKKHSMWSAQAVYVEILHDVDLDDMLHTEIMASRSQCQREGNEDRDVERLKCSDSVRCGAALRPPKMLRCVLISLKCAYIRRLWHKMCIQPTNEKYYEQRTAKNLLNIIHATRCNAGAGPEEVYVCVVSSCVCCSTHCVEELQLRAGMDIAVHSGWIPKHVMWPLLRHTWIIS